MVRDELSVLSASLVMAEVPQWPATFFTIRAGGISRPRSRLSLKPIACPPTPVRARQHLTLEEAA